MTEQWRHIPAPGCAHATRATPAQVSCNPTGGRTATGNASSTSIVPTNSDGTESSETRAREAVRGGGRWHTPFGAEIERRGGRLPQTEEDRERRAPPFPVLAF